MLKNRVVLIFALLVFSAQGHTQTRGESQDSPLLATTPSTPKQSDGPALGAVPQKHIDADVRVISSPTKDRYDITAFWISVFLAFVGCAGVVAAACTLRVINRQAREAKLQRIATHNTLMAIKRQADLMEQQAGHMEAQTEILKDSVAAANASAEAAKISADIAAGVSLPKLVIHELGKGNMGSADKEAFFQFPKMKITIKNYGQTAAFLKWWTLCFSCEDLPEIPIYGGPARGIILDKIAIQPNNVYTLPDLHFPHRHEFSIEEVRAILSREKPFRVYGYVCYGDVFGNPLKRLKFCETVLNIFGGETVCDWWEGFAPTAYTGTEDFPLTKNEEQMPI